MFFQLWGSFTNSKNQKITQNLSFKKKSKHNSTKIFKNFKFFNKKYHNPKIFENQCPTIFGNSWSMNFSKFMVHEFLKFNVPRFFATLAYLTG